MDNYYKQLVDLLCARERLNTLRDRADEIFNRYFPITARYTEVSTSGGGTKNDKMVSYLSELEESGIDSEIKQVIQKIDKLQSSICRMEIILQNVENISGVDNLEYKVLKLKYYENRSYTLQQIADKLCYSLDRIKQVSADVEKKLKSNYYTENTLIKC
jgi:DNA-directed RNA polymerase sigma subunit (sigma70/sigma32)